MTCYHPGPASYTSASPILKTSVINSKKSWRKIILGRKTVSHGSTPGSKCDGHFISLRKGKHADKPFQSHRRSRHMRTSGSLHWLSLLEPPTGSKTCDTKISSLTTKCTPVTQTHHPVSQYTHNLLWSLNQQPRFPLNTYLT